MRLWQLTSHGAHAKFLCTCFLYVFVVFASCARRQIQPTHPVCHLARRTAPKKEMRFIFSKRTVLFRTNKALKMPVAQKVLAGQRQIIRGQIAKAQQSQGLEKAKCKGLQSVKDQIARDLHPRWR